MAGTCEAVIVVDGDSATEVTIRTLPGRDQVSGQPALECLSREQRLANAGEAPVQLFEDGEYAYEFDKKVEGEPATVWQTDQPDIFSPDTPSGHRGRLRPRSYTGTLTTRLTADGINLGAFSLEVRSRKLDYRRHYRWMMDDIARTAVGLVGKSFAASQQGLTPNIAADTASAYQRFALLRHLIENPIVEAAIARVQADPHEDWLDETRRRDVRRGLSATGLSIRELISGAPRVSWPGSYIPGLSSLPAQLRTRRTDSTRDTVPNRFVKFALTDWLDTVQNLAACVKDQPQSASRARGLAEVAHVETVLLSGLASPVFSEVGQLSSFPSGNQVLARRAGYREIFQTYLDSQLAIGLSWSGGEAVFGAGQRNVAQLYEYWCYLTVADILRELCQEWDNGRLISCGHNQTNVELRSGKQSLVSGKAHRLGRVLDVQLYFNRTFPRQSHSWSVQMRPDCSISIAGDDEVDGTWVHLDAKYRVDTGDELFGGLPTVATADQDADSTSAKRDDLLKMHAYRDAIRRSAGAYVLYPGRQHAEQPPYRQYHEILPGLGAFSLRPAQDGPPHGWHQLSAFLDEVLNHRASSITQHRRASFWVAKSYAGDSPPLSGAPSNSGWPPADTGVLLGYVRDSHHLAWIHAQRRYNLRTGDRRGAVGLTSRELAAELLILYGPPLTKAEIWGVDGQPEVWSPKRMMASGYRRTEQTYFCLSVKRLHVSSPLKLTSTLARQLIQRASPGVVRGAPVVVTWLEVAEELA